MKSVREADATQGVQWLGEHSCKTQVVSSRQNQSQSQSQSMVSCSSKQMRMQVTARYRAYVANKQTSEQTSMRSKGLCDYDLGIKQLRICKRSVVV